MPTDENLTADFFPADASSATADGGASLALTVVDTDSSPYSSSYVDDIFAYLGSFAPLVIIFGIFVCFAFLRWLFRFVKKHVLRKKDNSKAPPADVLSAQKRAAEHQKEIAAKHLQQQKQQLAIEQSRQAEAEVSRRQALEAEHSQLTSAAEREHSAEERGKENVIEKIYPFDWSRDSSCTSAVGSATSPLSQYAVDRVRAQGITSFIYGADIQSEVASLLSSLIAMHDSGMSARQIARGLAAAKISNPSIDPMALEELVSAYYHILEEMGIAGDLSRYRDGRRDMPSDLSADKKDIAKALSKGDTSLLNQFFVDLAAFNVKKAANLDDGFLKDETRRKASEYMCYVADLNAPYDSAYAMAAAGKALELNATSAKASFELGSLYATKGDLEAACSYFTDSVNNAKDKRSPLYHKAQSNLSALEQERNERASNARYALYVENLTQARETVRSNIQNFFISNEADGKTLAVI